MGTVNPKWDYAILHHCGQTGPECLQPTALMWVQRLLTYTLHTTTFQLLPTIVSLFGYRNSLQVNLSTCQIRHVYFYKKHLFFAAVAIFGWFQVSVWGFPQEEESILSGCKWLAISVKSHLGRHLLGMSNPCGRLVSTLLGHISRCEMIR